MFKKQKKEKFPEQETEVIVLEGTEEETFKDKIEKQKKETIDEKTEEIASELNEKSEPMHKELAGINFGRMSNEKLFSMIRKVILENKRFAQEIDKLENGQGEFFERYKEEKKKSARYGKAIEKLAKELSHTYLKAKTQNANIKYNLEEIVEFIIRDVLGEQIDSHNRIIELETEVLSYEQTILEVKNNFSKMIESKNKDNTSEDGDDLDLSKEDFDKIVEDKPKVALAVIDLDEAREQIGDTEKAILEAVGKEGLSEAPDVQKYCLGKNESENKVQKSLEKLEKHGIIDVEMPKTLTRKRGVRIYSLDSNVGVQLYKEYFKGKPVVSEKERLNKQYGNTAHGYSVKESAELLETLGYIDIAFNDDQTEQKVGNEKWNPDLQGINPVTNKKEYFEVEFGKHSKEEMKSRLQKANLKAQIMRFIVPNRIAKQKVITKINEWKGSMDLQGKTISMLVSVGTVAELKEKDFGREFERK